MIKPYSFPIITSVLQVAYEKGVHAISDYTPNICGYYGRACRQMDSLKGANTALCQSCSLKMYCESL